MTEDTTVIDLRKIKKRSGTDRPEARRDASAPIAEEPLELPGKAAVPMIGATHEANAGSAEPMTAAAGVHIGWTAPEFRKQRWSAAWYGGYIIGAGALIALGILAKSYFFIAFIILASIVLAVHTFRTPRDVAYAITAEGIAIGDRLHPFSEFTSFCIFATNEGRVVSLEAKRTLARFVQLQLDGADPAAVRSALAASLPEQEHMQTLIDQLAQRFGF